MNREQNPESGPDIRPLSAGRVLVVMLVALLGGALLNAPGILRTAEQQNLGAGRSVALALAKPLAAVSSFLRIDVPRDSVDEALGREFSGRDVTIAAPSSTTTVAATTTTTSTTLADDPTAPTVVVPPTTTSLPPPPTTTTLPPLRSVNAEDPLRLWIIGDSFVELFGPALVNRCTDTGVIDATADFRYVSGLSRPDFFDWPAYIGDELPRVQPDAAVVIFGGNDGIDVEVGGERFDLGTEPWIDLYATRVGEAMDVLLVGVDRVYWIGLPIMRSSSFTTKVQMMNAIYESEADKRPGVTYISSFELFEDENGEYSAYLDGKLMRFRDGAHFVWNGAYRLADAVLPIVAHDWNANLLIAD